MWVFGNSAEAIVQPASRPISAAAEAQALKRVHHSGYRPTLGAPSPPTPAQQVALFNLITPLSAVLLFDRVLRTAAGTKAPTSPPPSGSELGLIDNDGITSPKMPYTVPPGTPLIVFDLDGTLTTDNTQLFRQLLHHSHRAKVRSSAAELTWA